MIIRTLRLNNNGIVDLPLGILNLQELDTLELNKNKLSSFYSGVQEHNLINLTFLSLNGNQLTSVPKVIRGFSKLRQLHLHMNKITDVEELCRPAYSGLEVLDLGNNKIKDLPVAFVHFLRNLNNLSLINNDLSQIPHLLGFLKNLNTV